MTTTVHSLSEVNEFESEEIMNCVSVMRVVDFEDFFHD